MKKVTLFLLIYILFVSCSSDDSELYEPILLEVEFPSNFPDMVYNLENNPLTEAGVELGKDLFYEGKLSINNSISCGTCHEQGFAFTHHGHNVSEGLGVGTRNTPPVQNMAYQNSFMWDGAATHLDFMPLLPITNEVEMGDTLENVISKLEVDSEYQEKFAQAFEDGEVNSENMLKAMSQFMIMMISSNSPYDKYVRGEDNVTLSTIELEGLNTFKAKCASCHATDLFTDQSFRNNGLTIDPTVDDKGRFNILENIDDLYKFKVPSLRNIAVTSPYMHDGRFYTLEAVLDFYNSGVVDNGNVDELLLKEDGTYGITLTDYEKESIIYFLNTLTDNEFLEDERFSEF